MTVKHCSEDAPTQRELEEFINIADDIDKLIFILAGKYTLRAGEIEHMKADWLHIGDDKAKDVKIDHIEIPKHGDPCTCDNCMLFEFRKLMKNKLKKNNRSKKKIKKPAEWWADMQDKYYKLKKKNNLPKLPVHIWIPKSDSGARIIPLVFKEYTSFIQDFFSKNDSIGIGRQAIWKRMKKHGIHPHNLRATAIMYWSKKNMHPRSRMKIAGHKHISAQDPYDFREVSEMIDEAKEIIKKDKK